MTVITNHFERALALLAGQFQESDPEGELTKFQRLIKAFVASFQDADNVDMDLLFDRAIDTAVGEQLDGLGEILGAERLDGESDDDYRERLKFQIYINNSNGTPEEVIAVLKFLTNANTIWYNELNYAAYQMTTDGTTFPDPPEQLVEAIQSVSPAGVQYVPITATYGVEAPFRFSKDPDFGLLEVVPSESNLNDVYNVEINTTDVLEVNAGQAGNPDFGGGFAEAIWSNEPTTPIVYEFDNTGAGQLPEVIQYNGSVAPNP
jgi:hypothetical protein